MDLAAIPTELLTSGHFAAAMLTMRPVSRAWRDWCDTTEWWCWAAQAKCDGLWRAIRYDCPAAAERLLPACSYPYTLVKHALKFCQRFVPTLMKTCHGDHFSTEKLLRLVMNHPALFDTLLTVPDLRLGSLVIALLKAGRLKPARLAALAEDPRLRPDDDDWELTCCLTESYTEPFLSRFFAHHNVRQVPPHVLAALVNHDAWDLLRRLLPYNDLSQHGAYFFRHTYAGVVHLCRQLSGTRTLFATTQVVMSVDIMLHMLLYYKQYGSAVTLVCSAENGSLTPVSDKYFDMLLLVLPESEFDNLCKLVTRDAPAHVPDKLRDRYARLRGQPQRVTPSEDVPHDDF